MIENRSGTLSNHIVGVDRQGRSTPLTKIDDDVGLDIALLAADNEYSLSNALPFELFFDQAAHDTKVTFPGLAFAQRNDITATSPPANTFEYNSEKNIALRSSTNDGDSGAPLYTIQNLVIGVVDKKQTSAQGVAMPIKKLVPFLERNEGGESAVAARAFLSRRPMLMF
jgi:hypothetical protein